MDQFLDDIVAPHWWLGAIVAGIAGNFVWDAVKGLFRRLFPVLLQRTGTLGALYQRRLDTWALLGLDDMSFVRIQQAATRFLILTGIHSVLTIGLLCTALVLQEIPGSSTHAGVFRAAQVSIVALIALFIGMTDQLAIVHAAEKRRHEALTERLRATLAEHRATAPEPTEAASR